MEALLRTPAKQVIREHVQNIREEATIGDAVAAFHACGLNSAIGSPNGNDSSSFIITLTGMDDDFQRVQAEVNATLKSKGLRMVSMSYHEDPATHVKTHVCVIKVTQHI
jgi:hypothetical protein